MPELECLRVPSCNGRCEKPGCPYRFDLSGSLASKKESSMRFGMMMGGDAGLQDVADEKDRAILPPDMLGSCLKALTSLLAIIPDIDDRSADDHAAIIFAESVVVTLTELGVKA